MEDFIEIFDEIENYYNVAYEVMYISELSGSHVWKSIAEM